MGEGDFEKYFLQNANWQGVVSFLGVILHTIWDEFADSETERQDNHPDQSPPTPRRSL